MHFHVGYYEHGCDDEGVFLRVYKHEDGYCFLIKKVTG
ncbi:hypothetical protein [Bacillus sp. 28A-2]